MIQRLLAMVVRVFETQVVERLFPMVECPFAIAECLFSLVFV